LICGFFISDGLKNAITNYNDGKTFLSFDQKRGCMTNQINLLEYLEKVTNRYTNKKGAVSNG